MKATKTNVMLILILGLTVLTSVACIKQSSPAVETVGQGDTVQAEVLPNEMATSSDWQTHLDGRFNFAYPNNWQVDVQPSESQASGSLTHRVRLQNTDKKIVLGGVAPDDYYVEGSGTIDTEKYADIYVMITVDVYNGHENKEWNEFFNSAYGTLIAEHQNYSVTIKSELNAVSAKRITGVYSGSPRFFVKQGDSVYDLALFYQGVDKTQAEQTFNTFIRGFTF